MGEKQREKIIKLDEEKVQINRTGETSEIDVADVVDPCDHAQKIVVKKLV